VLGLFVGISSALPARGKRDAAVRPFQREKKSGQGYVNLGKVIPRFSAGERGYKCFKREKNARDGKGKKEKD